jgi:acyl carrier protein
MSEHTTMEREDIYKKVVEILSETFDLQKEKITPKALLVQDLDLDSIDAVDLVVKLQQYTNKKIDPETFKQVRTIDDVVEALLQLANNGGSQGT